MNFGELVDRYPDKSIAILGSGKTLLEYEAYINQYDIVIACNGSLMSLNPEKHKIDYFIYGDYRAPERQWFYRSEDFKTSLGNDCIRISPFFLLHADKIVTSDANLQERLREEFNNFMKEKSRDEEIKFNPDVFDFENFNGYPYKLHNYQPKLIKRGFAPLIRGATITGTAALLAYKMGAKSIGLFGCAFDNNVLNDGNFIYSYDSRGEYGRTSGTQKSRMNRILSELSKDGVEVEIWVESNLKVA